MNPKASVIIPHYDDKDRLSLCLASLERCCDRAKVEIIVVDNGQPRLDTAFINSHGDIRFHYQPEAGAAQARNAGILLSRGHILIFTDSDCEVAPDFLTKALCVGATRDIAGGRVLLSTTGTGPTNAIQAFEQVFSFNQRRYIEDQDFSVTANLVTNAEVFQTVGPFRAGVSEDYDWCQRATAIGYKLVYQPDLIVSHPCRTSWDQLRSKWVRVTAETYGTHLTNNGAKTRWIARALMMPLSIVAHTPRVIWSPALTTPKERAGALTTLARLRLWRMAEMIRLAARRGAAETR
ncbi:GT2 family glycosyltransferase [Litoreibacter meonggei]|uniref:GT2 family glycosyltransferase n=1 Tax=Litoreibacter meonggei TaxID=1049199 RepID=A0A497VD76_9RHOB|nr:glycosyltransferase [Litoreibacter meonggei]RLJ41440.1 GT2 family glycosyltransferase [Litoreibacter meonggei]